MNPALRSPLGPAVVTVVSGRRSHLRRQRLALEGQPVACHVVVSIGAAPDLPASALSTTVVRLPAADPDLPLARARNQGAAVAIAQGADPLIFLDVDCIPSRTLVDEYVQAAARAPQRAIVCGPVHYLPPPGPGGYPHSGLHRLAGPHPGRPVPPPGTLRAEERFELFWSLSFCVSARTWSTLGGFDEGFVGYGAEDTDWAIRSCEAGASLWWLGGAHAFHQHHPPAREAPHQLRSIVGNAKRFHSRHGWWPMRPWLVELAAAGAVRFEPDGDVLEVADR